MQTRTLALQSPCGPRRCRATAQSRPPARARRAEGTLPPAPEDSVRGSVGEGEEEGRWRTGCSHRAPHRQPTARVGRAMLVALVTTREGTCWHLRPGPVLERRRAKAAAAAESAKRQAALDQAARDAQAASEALPATGGGPAMAASATATRPAPAAPGSPGGCRPQWLQQSASALADFESRVRKLQDGVTSLTSGLSTIRQAEAMLSERRRRIGAGAGVQAVHSLTDLLRRMPPELLGSVVAFAGVQAAGALARSCRIARARLLDDACWAELGLHRWGIVDPLASDGPAAAALYVTAAAAAAERDASFQRRQAVREEVARCAQQHIGGGAATAQPLSEPKAAAVELRPDALSRGSCLFRFMALGAALRAVAVLDRAVRGGVGQAGASSGAVSRASTRVGLALAVLVTSCSKDTTSAKRLLSAGALDALGHASADASGAAKELAAAVLANMAAVADPATRAEVAAAASGSALVRHLRDCLASPRAHSQPLAAREAARALANVFLPDAPLALPLSAHQARGLMEAAARADRADERGSARRARRGAGAASQPPVPEAAADLLAAAAGSSALGWIGAGAGAPADPEPWTLLWCYSSGEVLPSVELSLSLRAAATGSGDGDRRGAAGEPGGLRVAIVGRGADQRQLLVLGGVAVLREDRPFVSCRLQGWHAGPVDEASAAADAVCEAVRDGGDGDGRGVLEAAGTAPHLELLLHSCGVEGSGVDSGFWGVWEVARGPRSLSAQGGGALGAGGVARLVRGRAGMQQAACM